MVAAKAASLSDYCIFDSQNSVDELCARCLCHMYGITISSDVSSDVCAVFARARVLRNHGSREIAVFSRGHEFSSFQGII